MKSIKKIFEIIGLIILVLTVGLAGFMMLGPRFGYNTYSVLTGSMEPVLNVGGVIVTKTEKIEQIDIGDIITFQTEPGPLVTHRVIEIIHKDGVPWFKTKGDASEEADLSLVSSRIGVIRKVMLHVPYIGFVAWFLSTDWAFLIMIGIPTLILVGMLAIDLKKAVEEEKERRRRKISENEKMEARNSG